jgi:hypothetical protein
VGAYTKDVKAFLRRSQRKGLKHKPATVVEVMLLEYDQRERQIKALEGIEDALRIGVISLLCSFLSDFYLLGWVPSLGSVPPRSVSCARRRIGSSAFRQQRRCLGVGFLGGGGWGFFMIFSGIYQWRVFRPA